MNYNNKRFIPISNSDNAEVSSEIIFHYYQTNNILTCEYFGKNIQKGNLIGLVDKLGNIEMSYHHINKKGKLMTGTCHSKPEVMKNGKIVGKFCQCFRGCLLRWIEGVGKGKNALFCCKAV